MFQFGSTAATTTDAASTFRGETTGGAPQAIPLPITPQQPIEGPFRYVAELGVADPFGPREQTSSRPQSARSVEYATRKKVVSFQDAHHIKDFLDRLQQADGIDLGLITQAEEVLAKFQQRPEVQKPPITTLPAPLLAQLSTAQKQSAEAAEYVEQLGDYRHHTLRHPAGGACG